MHQRYCALTSNEKKIIKLGESVTHGLSHKEVIVILSFVQEIYYKYLVVFFGSQVFGEEKKHFATMAIVRN